MFSKALLSMLRVKGGRKTNNAISGGAHSCFEFSKPP